MPALNPPADGRQTIGPDTACERPGLRSGNKLRGVILTEDAKDPPKDVTGCDVRAAAPVFDEPLCEEVNSAAVAPHTLAAPARPRRQFSLAKPLL